MVRIAIIGAGAVGSVFGALLDRAGQDVTLIARPAHVAAMRRQGLRVDGYLGSFTAPVAAAEVLDFRPDLALLAVKTQDVLGALRGNLAFLAGVPLVTLQNGVRSDELAASLLPAQQIVGGVVSTLAIYLNPGSVTLGYPGPLVIGRPGGPRDAQVEAVAGVLGQAVPTRVTDNVRGARWLKLIVNLNNALPAATNLAMTEVYADPFLRRLAVMMMREGLRVAARAGILLESLPDVSVTLARLVSVLPVGVAANVAGAKARRFAAGQPLLGSTLQSLRRGRPTEIDYLNGEVVRLGQELGVPTPLNASVVGLVHRVEETGRFWEAAEVGRAVGAI